MIKTMLTDDYYDVNGINNDIKGILNIFYIKGLVIPSKIKIIKAKEKIYLKFK